jgi:propionyl-CoA carboxylase alpha chain
VGSTVYVDGPDGSSMFEEAERFPLPGASLSAGSLVAPLPGTVVRVTVGVGDTVGTGDVLVAIEAMKMEHEVRAQGAGTVTEVHVAAGDQVDAGRLLVVVLEPGAGGTGSGEGGEEPA